MTAPTTRPPGFAAVVVVNYGSHALVDAGLAALTPDLAQVVVVDNRTTAQEAAAVRALGASRGWDVLTLPTNAGFGVACNRGAAHALAAGAGAVVLVNPDLEIGPDALAALVDAVTRDPGTAVSPTILRPDGSVWFSGGQVLVHQGGTRTAGADSSGPDGWLSGACLAMSAELWQRVGGFDPDYFLYWEDVDLSVRVTAAGGRLRVLPDVTVVHAVGGTQGERRSLGYYRWNTRNRLVFAAKHLDRHDQLLWARTSIRFARTVLRRGDLRGLGPRSWRPILSAARGTLAGLAAVARPHRH